MRFVCIVFTRVGAAYQNKQMLEYSVIILAFSGRNGQWTHSIYLSF